MRFINIDNLTWLGGGSFGSVYRLSPRRIIKVYNYIDVHDNNIMIDEMEASLCSEHALPVLDIVTAVRSGYHYYAVIKKYLPFRVTYTESQHLKRNLPKKLQWDCHSGNALKDYNGKVFLVDTQGTYAKKLCGW
jgi:hypothetical protein